MLNRHHFIKENDGIEVSFSNRDKLIIGGFIFTLGLIVWGILSKGWYMTEIGALFFALGIFSGIVTRMSQKEIAENFVKGCGEFIYV
ncbi:hypothetical protein MHI32_22870 [Paenibacillus sp. FSL H7-0690]|uniref:hypothetical protein n=1 Tax=Paenibacillus sp. FSL H7-0690 TaxID=2921437 RepID=UPI0030EB8A05